MVEGAGAATRRAACGGAGAGVGGVASGAAGVMGEGRRPCAERRTLVTTSIGRRSDGLLASSG
eukprot:scaffold4556_cov114-Isochrysis_galbana.AAC.12